MKYRKVKKKSVMYKKELNKELIEIFHVIWLIRAPWYFFRMQYWGIFIEMIHKMNDIHCTG